MFALLIPEICASTAGLVAALELILTLNFLKSPAGLLALNVYTNINFSIPSMKEYPTAVEL